MTDYQFHSHIMKIDVNFFTPQNDGGEIHGVREKIAKKDLLDSSKSYVCGMLNLMKYHEIYDDKHFNETSL